VQIESDNAGTQTFPQKISTDTAPQAESGVAAFEQERNAEFGSPAILVATKTQPLISNSKMLLQADPMSTDALTEAKDQFLAGPKGGGPRNASLFPAPRGPVQPDIVSGKRFENEVLSGVDSGGDIFSSSQAVSGNTSAPDFAANLGSADLSSSDPDTTVPQAQPDSIAPNDLSLDFLTRPSSLQSKAALFGPNTDPVRPDTTKPTASAVPTTNESVTSTRVADPTVATIAKITTSNAQISNSSADASRGTDRTKDTLPPPDLGTHAARSGIAPPSREARSIAAAHAANLKTSAMSDTNMTLTQTLRATVMVANAGFAPLGANPNGGIPHRGNQAGSIRAVGAPSGGDWVGDQAGAVRVSDNKTDNQGDDETRRDSGSASSQPQYPGLNGADVPAASTPAGHTAPVVSSTSRIETGATGGRSGLTENSRPDGRVPQTVLDSTPLAEPGHSPGSVSTSAAGASELRLNLTTNVFGRIEMHTVVHDNRVGLSMSSERGDLRAALGADTGQLDASLQHHDLRLHEMRFTEHGAALANFGGGMDRSNHDRAGNDPGGREQGRPEPTHANPVGHARSISGILPEDSLASASRDARYLGGGLSVHA